MGVSIPVTVLVGQSAQDRNNQMPYLLAVGASTGADTEIADQTTAGISLMAEAFFDTHPTSELIATPRKGDLEKGSVWYGRTPFTSELGKHILISDLSAFVEYAGDDITLKVHAGAFAPIEGDYTYTYDHTASVRGMDGLRHAGFDTKAPSDAYNPFMGPFAATALGFSALTLSFQTGTAGEDITDTSRTFQAVQGRLDHTFEGDTTIQLSAYRMVMNPTSDTDDNERRLSDMVTLGGGALVRLGDNFKAEVGYSQTDQTATGEGHAVASLLTGLNLSASAAIGDSADLTVGLSQLEGQETLTGFTSETTGGEEQAVEARLTVKTDNLADGSNFGIGYQQVTIDKGEAVSEGDGNRSKFDVSWHAEF